MTPELAALTVATYLRETFGLLLQTRTPERRRRPAGATWSVPVVAVSSDEGEIPIAYVDVDEAGVLFPVLQVDDVIEALRRAPASSGGRLTIGEFTEAELLFADEGRDVGVPESAEEASSRRLWTLLQKTDSPSLLEARRLLPPLLSDAERRGRVLMMMAEVERRLGETRLALSYIDAAAHELADRFDMPMLERSAAVAFAIAGEAGFVDLPIRPLLHRCRARLRPLESLFESPILSLVPREHRRLIEDHARLTVLAPNEVLTTEGEPSTALFVIKSGILTVAHENPSWRFVRCCSPGWLLGESSVLVEVDPRCTATLRAEHLTEVWRIEAEVMRGVMRDVPQLTAKIVETRTIHGLDSFFSAHAFVGQLDAEVRNEMLQCLQSIQTFEERTVVIPPGEVPAVACLVARGKLSLHEGWEVDSAPSSQLGVDEFVGIRDALHHVATNRTVVAEQGATVVFFDSKRLRELVEKSPEQAVLVLERLG